MDAEVKKRIAILFLVLALFLSLSSLFLGDSSLRKDLPKGDLSKSGSGVATVGFFVESSSPDYGGAG